MGLTILLMRHFEDEGIFASSMVPDKECRLTPKGKTQSTAMRKFLIDNDLIPDKTYVANCVRTSESFEEMKLDVPADSVETEDSLYYGNVGAYIEKVLSTKDLPNADDIKTLGIVGRRPQIPQFVKLVMGLSDEDIPFFNDGNYGNGMLCVMNFPNIDKWEDLYSHDTRLFAESELRVFAPDDSGNVIELGAEEDAPEQEFPRQEP